MAGQEHSGDLVTLQLQVLPPDEQELSSANGAPLGEPETWSPNVADFNPHLGHAPESSPIEVSASFAASDQFKIADYLAHERGKDLLRFSTAGSVDDGKSTLIGRLLYDTESVYDDQIRSIEGKGTTSPGVLDLALLTDGLRAEREQGITIDVAYRYFSTSHRKFIIADTPGHEQYTRNMATGASTADVAIVLVDARKGVLSQSRRHAFITALLGVEHVIVAVNKMDLVSYEESIFSQIQADFLAFFDALDPEVRKPQLYFVPVSALAGDNVVHVSGAMPWYKGQPLLALLESLPAQEQASSKPFRMAVQRVIRPNLDFRGFAGQIASGSIHPGDRVSVLPSGQSSRVRRIVTFEGDLSEAEAPLSITLVLDDEIDVSRGDLLVDSGRPATVASSFAASLVWMDTTPLRLDRRYLLKHTSRTVQAQVRKVMSVTNLTDLTADEVQGSGDQSLSLNGIGKVALETLQPIAFDSYSTNRHTGSFVLIDLETNATVAAGMIRRALPVGRSDTEGLVPRAMSEGAVTQVTARDRVARYGHTSASLRVTGSGFALALERALFERGCLVLSVEESAAAIVPVLLQSGALVIVASATSHEGALSLTINEETRYTLPADLSQAVGQSVQFLYTAGVLQQGDPL